MDVVFQLTGLIMIVPPKQSGGRTHLLMPPAHDHIALLGVGYAVQDTMLCVGQHAGICYVDLRKWSVDTIGIGGTATDPDHLGIPDEVLNVTRVAGPNYRVHVPAGNGNGALRAHLVFAAGRGLPNPCSRARWTYAPVSTGTTVTQPLANVASWAIRYKRGEPFVLRFTRHGPAATREVRLDTSGDAVKLLIAHVPPEDLSELPLVWPAAAQNPPQKLDHINDYYSMLRHQTLGTPPGGAPVPDYAGEAGPICRVSITTFDKKFTPEWLFGIKTYGCVIGSGEG
jgi:hypothetical protein